MSPGADGVLRLDRGGAYTWPCAPRRLPAYAAFDLYSSPPVLEKRAIRSPAGTAVPAKLASAPTSESGPPPAAAIDEDAAPKAKDATGKDLSKDLIGKDLDRLRTENARLKDEASRLRDETNRLKDQLALRDAAPAVTPKAAPTGDLPPPEPQAGGTGKTPPDQKTAQQLADEQAFNRQKGVVERAWNQLRDLAARMKQDLAR